MVSEHSSPIILSLQQHLRQAASLLVYQTVWQEPIGQHWLSLLKTLLTAAQTTNVPEQDCLTAYGHWFNTLASANLGWQRYLLHAIAQSDNPFSRVVQQQTPPPDSLLQAVRSDLRQLQSLYRCTSSQISQWIQILLDLPEPPIAWADAQDQNSPLAFLHHSEDWGSELDALATYYRQFGTGLFAQYQAVRWTSDQLIGISAPDPTTLTQLAGYRLQRELLIKNTEFLLAGLPSLHVLLYGSRGSGKSSLVKALLQEYADRGLRLVEVSKSTLNDLPQIVDQLRDLPQKFIIFVDDLSFEEDDEAFKALKVVLEGGVTARPQNIVVYATSNRRHLIREFFADRPQPSAGDEVHSWDTVQEKLSFSDRFGLTLTFEPADQPTYLEIVRHLAAQNQLELSQEDLDFRALQWATRHNGRSGRTARQFIDFLRAELTFRKGT